MSILITAAISTTIGSAAKKFEVRPDDGWAEAAERHPLTAGDDRRK